MAEDASSLTETEIKDLAEKLAQWMDGLTPSECAYFEMVAAPFGAYGSDDTRGFGYMQLVQLSTQLTNELQNTERELVDALQSQYRTAATFWETVAGARDADVRTANRIMSTR